MRTSSKSFRREYDYLVEKNLPESFTDTDLKMWLREKNIDTVMIRPYGPDVPLYHSRTGIPPWV